MNLLPKTHKEFGEKDYWNTFFKKRGCKSFEWYGEYLELCSHLHKYIKQNDNILVTGCGNSSLSADLYDAGFTNITNIDVSEVVIKQMNSINSKREKMSYICMDATKMEFDNEFFNVVLDKGTLDALMPDESDETIKIIDGYFCEIKRVLKLGGRFLCISLLQEHIMNKLVSSFCDGSWMVRIVRCHDAEEKNSEDPDTKSFPVFAVIATKFKKLPQMVLEVCMAGDKMQRVSSPKELCNTVKTAQDAAVITNGLSNITLNKDEEVILEVCPVASTLPRYTLYVIDNVSKQSTHKYGVFIVPQGRESEWLFGTSTGRRQLQSLSGHTRLVVALLHRGQEYRDLDLVKEELSHCSKMLAPRGFSGQIPFLSIGNDVGKRIKVYQGTSKTTGDFVVEDVDVDGETTRRLIFLDNQFLVQSEARIKTVESKGKTQTVIDFGHISSYHAFMSVGVVISQELNPTCHVALLGVGGGSLCMFLRKCCQRLRIDAVDVDVAVCEIAKRHFGLKEDENLNVHVKDGLDFLQEEVEKGTKYDAVLFDMDSKDRSVGLSCPPQAFLHKDVLQNVSKLLTNTGHFILNLACRDRTLHDSLIVRIQANFRHVLVFKLYEELNEVVLASNHQKYSPDLLERATKLLNTRARERKLVKINCVDIKTVLESAQIVC